MKTQGILIAGLTLAIPSFGQEALSAATGQPFLSDPINHPMFPYYGMFFLLFISLVLVAVVGLYVLRITRMLAEAVAKEKATKLGKAYIPAPGWWETFNQRFSAAVPVEQEKEIEMDHSYDGIKELDNHLPPWWKWLFYGTIAWSAVYIVVFHFSNTLPLSLEEYQAEITIAEEQAEQRRASQPVAEAIDESKLEFTSDPLLIEKGKSVFASNPCGSCHRDDGGGNTIGPNLADEYWIHGGDIKSVFNTIKNGAVDKGMPAWGKAMSPQELRDLTYYVISLQGTNPPNGKAPQGELFKLTLKTDSTQTQASIH